MGTKESIYKGKELNSQRICLVHQHGHRFIVLEHQYGHRDVMYLEPAADMEMKENVPHVSSFLRHLNEIEFCGVSKQ